MRFRSPPDSCKVARNGERLCAMAAPVGQQAALYQHLAACKPLVLLEGCSMAYRELEDHGLFTICSLITTKLGSLKHLSA